MLRPARAVKLEEGLLVLSGVFTPTFRRVDRAGRNRRRRAIPRWTTRTCPTRSSKDYNGYHSAKLGLFSEASGAMHEVLFGGISLQYHERRTRCKS